MNKLFKNILYLSSLTLALASCQSEEKVAPGEQDLDGCFGVYFPAQKETTDLTLDPSDPTSAKVTVMRSKSEGAITVPVTVKDTSGLFVYTPITFEDGQSETTFDLTFDNIAIGSTYMVSFTIDDPQYASKYSSNPTSLDFKVLREKWNELGVGTWDEEGYFEFGGVPDNVVIYQNDLNKNLYRIALQYPDANGETYSVYSDKSDQYMVLRVLKAGDTYKDVKVTTDGLVAFDIFDTGIYNKNYPSSPIWFVHPSSFTSLASEDKWLYNKVLMWQDEKNTLPAGIQLAPYYYINGVGGWDYTQQDGIITIVFPGAALTDYTVEVTAGETADGEIPVEFTLGKDVASAKYAAYEGELSKAAAERHANAIAKGTEDSQAVPESGAVSLKFDKSGVYSVVAVTFDEKGDFQSSEVATFNYVAKGDEENYAVNVSAGLELTSRYAAQGYTKLNSAEFYVYGKDITDVKMTVLPAAKLDMEKVDSVARAQKSVSDSVLNLVNTNGWSDLVTGLSPLTKYTLVVWASNGYSSKVVTADVTTDGLAKVKKGTGTYTYTIVFTDDEENPVSDEGLELYADPNYKNTYVIPNWGYGVDFTFTYDPATGKVNVPQQATGAESQYGMIYVMEAKDYYPESYKDYSKLSDSKYDAATGTFSFCVAYVVSAGSFGYGVETFKVDGNVSFSTSGKAASKPYAVRLNNSGRMLGHARVRAGVAGASLAGIRAERQSSAVEFSARAIQKGSVSSKVDFTKRSTTIKK